MWIGFKGTHNASSLLVQALPGDRCLLTNSFAGLHRGIAALETADPYAVLFGVDKTSREEVRIEAAVRNETGERCTSQLDLRRISETLTAAGIQTHCCSACHTQSLCGTAYWQLLQKFHGREVQLHIPTIRYYRGDFAARLVQACTAFLEEVLLQDTLLGGADGETSFFR